MTIKELEPILKSMDTFKNPQNKPIEELKFKYTSNNNVHEELIPALDQKWCNKDYIFTLYIPPPAKNVDGEFTMGSKEDWIERIFLFIEDMEYLLQLTYHRFWSEVMYNSNCLDGLSSFLQNASPFYMRDQLLQDNDVIRVFKKAQESVFLVLVRLTRTKESEQTWMKKNTLGNILYNNFVLSLPQLMEICLIYTNDNFKEVTEIINRIIDIQPNYLNDIEKSTTFISEVFSQFENQLNSAIEVNGGPSVISNYEGAITSVEVVRLILLMLDISYSLSMFLEVCPRASLIFHDQQLEPRIANFYGNTVPVLKRHLDAQYKKEDSLEKYENYQFKINLSRHQLVLAARSCLTSFLSTLIEDRDGLSEQELKIKVDTYLNTISECLSDHIFVRDYNSAFPIQNDLNILTDICPEIDSLKCEFIVESVISLYELPPKQQMTAISSTIPSKASSSTLSIPNHSSKEIHQNQSHKKVTGVELDSLITEVKDILPHLGDGFIAKCLEYFNFVSPDVINAILENNLPESLSTIDPVLPIIPPEPTEEESSDFTERLNLYDNDEFDIMTQDKVDTSRIHRGKRQQKHKDLAEMLDDKSHVNQLRDVYSHLSLVECLENVNEYEDEYDDTYDDVDVPVGNEGEKEEERRAFVTPRVLQQYKKSVEEPLEYENEEEEENEGARADFFIENPADVRARAEQRRLDMRGRGGGRSRPAYPRHDVVGKPKGHGQEKEVIASREFKNTHKSSRGNHNRRSMAAKKRRQGMLPT